MVNAHSTPYAIYATHQNAAAASTDCGKPFTVETAARVTAVYALTRHRKGLLFAMPIFRVNTVAISVTKNMPANVPHIIHIRVSNFTDEIALYAPLINFVNIYKIISALRLRKDGYFDFL